MSQLGLTKASAQIAKLEAELKASRTAHAKAVLALENARKAKPKAPAIRKASAFKRGDIVEVILSDVHGSKQCPKAVAAALADIKMLNDSLGVDRVILLGDILDVGGFLAEHHTLGFIPETSDGGYEADIAAANAFLNQLEKAAPTAAGNVHYIAGNHEHRVDRWILRQKLARQEDINFLQRQFGAEHVLKLADRGISYYPYGQVNEGYSVRGWCNFDNLHFTHKVSNARNAAYSALGTTTGNIIFGDTHRQDYHPVSDQEGNLRAAWNTGCLCEPQPYYAQTRNTGWTHGYCVRFIDKAADSFQMIQILIDRGRSMAGHIFNRK